MKSPRSTRPTSRAGSDHLERSRNQRALAGLARDAALARIGRARVLMLVTAVVLTALLAALASALLPGKSLGASSKKAVSGTAAPRPATAASNRGSSTVAPPLPAPTGPAALGLQGPDQAPTAVPPAQVSPSSQPAAPPPPPAPAPSSGGGAVVSGGS